MPELGLLVAFSGAALLLLVLPGPAVLFIVARSLQLGRAVGLVSALGLTAGSLVHVFATVLGLSALIAASSGLYTLIKLAGAGYLIYLGIRALVGKDSPSPQHEETPRPASRHFLDGFLVNVFNPKLSLFFLAFLPQFVRPGSGPVQSQLLVLGLLFATLLLLVDIAYALVASSAHPYLAKRQGALRAQRYFSGFVYLGLGIVAAVTGRRATS